MTFQAEDLTEEEQNLIKGIDFTQLIPKELEQVLSEETNIRWMRASEPFTNSQLVKIIQPDDEPVEVEVPEMEEFFPTKLIVGWKEMQEEYPHPEEIKEYGIALDEQEHEILIALDEQEHEILDEYDLSAQIGDKLAGWPSWGQSVEYPNCPTCNQNMNQFVFQFESYGNVNNFPYPHGGLGVGCIVQCPEHKEQVTFFCQFT